jgi:hypothetical protein
MIHISSSFRLAHATLIHTAEAPASDGSDVAALEKARAELEGMGAIVTANGPGLLHFDRPFLSLGRSWIVYLGRGELRVIQSSGQLQLTIQATLIPLIGVAAVFGVVAWIAGVPLGIDLSLVLIFAVGNGLIAFFRLRTLARRVLASALSGAA